MSGSGKPGRLTLAAALAALAAALIYVLPASPSAAASTTFAATADTYVDGEAPATNFGSGAEMMVDASPVKRMFMKFTVTGLAQPVQQAKLRLHVRDVLNANSSAGGTVSKITDTGWSETAVTYNAQPAISGPALGTLPPVNRNIWYEVDVTSAVTGNGTFSFGVTTTNTDGAYYDTRESGANAPKLVVTHGTTPPADPVLVGAGDIAGCDGTGDEATANLLDGIPGTVFTAGDNAYPNATAQEYADCYGPSWGRHKARTKPAPGNHEYIQAGAAPYYAYFGAAAGDPAKGYYSYDLGNWHVVVLNTNCAAVGGCEAGSPQELWLRQDLQSSAKSCTAAIGHHPLFTSGPHTNATEVRPLYQALYDNNAEVFIAGHNHQYERFAPQNPDGVLDNTRGIREFVAGMGGRTHYQFATPQPNSEVRHPDTYGVLKLTLRTGGYDWQFVPEAGKTFTDSGMGSCH